MADDTASANPPGDDAPERPQTLAEMFAEIWSKIPEENWADVPHDLSINLDKYLYGGDEEE